MGIGGATEMGAGSIFICAGLGAGARAGLGCASPVTVGIWTVTGLGMTIGWVTVGI